MQKITPCLWFNTNAEAAVKYYLSVFPNAKRGKVMRYDAASAKVSGQKKGSVLTIDFTIMGVNFLALNGGPLFKFSQATSFMIDCKSQKEVDHYWNALSKGGEKQPCGWVIDQFGVTWQVVPSKLQKLLADSDPKKSKRVMEAMLQMQKLDIAKLEAAAKGK